MERPSWHQLQNKMIEIEARKSRNTGQAVDQLMMAPDFVFEKMKEVVDGRLRSIGQAVMYFRNYIRTNPPLKQGREKTNEVRLQLHHMVLSLPVEYFEHIKSGWFVFLDGLMPMIPKQPTQVKSMHGTLVAAEYLRPGDMVYINSDGKASKMNQTSAPAIGIVSSVAGPVGADEPVTVMVTKQVTQMAGLNLGFNLDTTQAQEAFKKLKVAFGEIQKSMLAVGALSSLNKSTDDAADAMAYSLMSKLTKDQLKMKADGWESQTNAIKRFLDKPAEPEPVIEVVPEAPKARRRNRVFEDEDDE